MLRLDPEDSVHFGGLLVFQLLLLRENLDGLDLPLRVVRVERLTEDLHATAFFLPPLIEALLDIHPRRCLRGVHYH